MSTQSLWWASALPSGIDCDLRWGFANWLTPGAVCHVKGEQAHLAAMGMLSKRGWCYKTWHRWWALRCCSPAAWSTWVPGICTA